MRILITDSDSRSALAATRALGQRGHSVITSGHRFPSLASSSRYSDAFEAYPDPAANESRFVAAIAEIVRRREVDVLMPMTEVTTLIATQHRMQLPAGCRLPFASAEAVALTSDKASVIRLAGEQGVPVPLTVVITSALEGIGQADSLPYPVVVKPSRSRVRVGQRWISTRVHYAQDPAALRRMLEGLESSCYPVLLQERIEGPGMGLFVCMDQGRPVALFAHRRIREKPPSGGVSVLCESMPLDADAVDFSNRLLSPLQWRGVAMIEFKKDLRDGSLRLMEINARFWGSLQLAIDAGVDFPSLLVDLAAGRPAAKPAAYRVGVRSRWLAGDLDALLMQLGRSRRRLNLPQAHPGRIRCIWDFMRFWGRDLHYEIERWSDCGPARLEWRRRVFGC